MRGLVVALGLLSAGACSYDWSLFEPVDGTPGVDATVADASGVDAEEVDAGGADADAVDVGVSDAGPGDTFGRVPGALALYLLDEGGGMVVRDTSGHPAGAADLEIESLAGLSWNRGFLTFDNNGIVSDRQVTTKLYEELGRAVELTLELWIRTTDVNQTGPGRIVTYSEGSSGQNFMIGHGEEGAGGVSTELKFRLRASLIDPMLTTGSPQRGFDAVSGEMQHVVVTHDSSRASGEDCYYVDSVEDYCDARPGDYSTWDPAFRLSLGNEPGSNRPWLGEIHMVAIYARALSQPEIDQNYLVGPDPELL